MTTSSPYSKDCQIVSIFPARDVTLTHIFFISSDDELVQSIRSLLTCFEEKYAKKVASLHFNDNLSEVTSKFQDSSLATAKTPHLHSSLNNSSAKQLQDQTAGILCNLGFCSHMEWVWNRL